MADPGSTVRNAFGPSAGDRAGQCRGACGAGGEQLRRVETFDCGTHQGCRVHDDCLDACLQSGVRDGTCRTRCDTEVMEQFGFESSATWLTGGGPRDGRISFEYARDAPAALEPAFRCPEGASRQCGDLAAPSGRLPVPMYQPAQATKPGEIRERRIRCTHRGMPVLETTFRLYSDVSR